MCPTYDHSPLFQARWLATKFRRWLEQIPARKIVGVAGNHDFVFERTDLVPADLPWEYLQDSGTEFEGVKIWGTPWCPPFGPWAFMRDDRFRKLAFQTIPGDTDILVTHGPPRGVLDITADGERVGCPHLTMILGGMSPVLHVFGHIHEARGITAARSTIFANVSHVDEWYRSVHAPMIFELPTISPHGK